MTSRIDKLFSALVNGEELTVKQIRNRFGLANPTSAIFKLREEIYPYARIFLNEKKTGVKKYRYWQKQV